MTQEVRSYGNTRPSIICAHWLYRASSCGRDTLQRLAAVAGVFDDTITEMCQELKSGVVPILIPTHNAVHDLGYNRDRYDVIGVMLPRTRTVLIPTFKVRAIK